MLAEPPASGACTLILLPFELVEDRRGIARVELVVEPLAGFRPAGLACGLLHSPVVADNAPDVGREGFEAARHRTGALRAAVERLRQPPSVSSSKNLGFCR